MGKLNIDEIEKKYDVTGILIEEIGFVMNKNKDESIAHYNKSNHFKQITDDLADRVYSVCTKKSKQVDELEKEIKKLKELVENPWVSVEDKCPAIGQKVILYSNGVVQEEIYIFDSGDTSDYAPQEYFWGRDDIEDCPLVKNSDCWMPLPNKPIER